MTQQTDSPTLAERLRKRRRELDLTQDDVAKACGVTQANVSLWEKGEITPTTARLRDLAAVLDLPLEELVP